jgi:hypothetical protein
MIDNLLRANLSTINRYFGGLMELIYGDKPPAEVIKRIEAPPSGLDALDEEEGDDEDDEDGEMPFAPDEEEDDEDGRKRF